MSDDQFITVGFSRTVDCLPRFTVELLQFRGKKRQPLTFPEFQKLITRDSPNDFPDTRELIRNDPVLALSDSELSAQYPDIYPVDIRRLRVGFLEKRVREIYKIHYDYENQILSALRPQILIKKATYADYADYLAAFHAESLESFFRLWALPVSVHDLKAHSYIGAGSGHGKSELMKAMIHALMEQGHGIILLDPLGDIAEQVAHWQEFEKNPERLCYFSPYLAGKNAEGERLTVVPGLNPLSTLHNALDLDSVVENFIDTIAAVIGSEGEISARMKTILKPCLYTLAKYPETTLYDLLAFISESEPDHAPWVDRARRTLTNRSQLDTLESFFDKHYATTKNAVRDRLRALLSSDALDRCLTSENTVDLETLMNQGKVIVFNLSAGTMGSATSAGFGRFVLCAVQNAAMRRQSVAAHQRKSVFLFMDEADRFMSEAVISVYKETRKYGLHLTIAQQITGYGMSDEMWRAIAGNSRVRFAGSAGGDKTTERDLAYMVGIEADELKHLKPLNFYTKSGDQEPIRFQLGKDLLGHRHSMSAEAWERVKVYQLATYYRDIGLQAAQKDQRSVQKYSANLDVTPSKRKKSLDFDY
ncbi:MAG: hypothetical protein IPP10_16030 [Candidatus Competibacteraceae bacterium]|nr:hypothetical protein [Candidatus Competibacteraceae bacterium]